jgi:hypothetical protein
MSLEIQRQIKENCESVNDVFRDLQAWTNEIKKVENKKPSVTAGGQQTKPTADVKQQPSSTDPAAVLSKPAAAEVTSSSVLLKRDKNNLTDYYKAWNKFEIDEDDDVVETERRKKGKDDDDDDEIFSRL